MPHEIAIILPEDFVGLSVWGAADLFETANRIAQFRGQAIQPFSLRFLSVDGKEKTGPGGCKTPVSGGLEQIDRPAVVMVPGINAGSEQALDGCLRELEPLQRMLPELLARGVLVTGCCTGTLVLADSGILNNKRATTTWWLEQVFKTRFPDVFLDIDAVLLRDGNVVTSAAGASALDLALHIISSLEGPELARHCARMLLVDDSRRPQRPYIIPWHSGTRTEFIEKADHWIRRHIERECDVSGLAVYMAVSQRTLLRRFRDYCGKSPAAYIQDVKMDKIMMSLESGEHTVSQLAARFGFSDENALRRAFTRHAGMSPVQYRRRYRDGF